MLQVANRSDFLPLVSVLPDESGTDTLYVVIKGTFALPATSSGPPTPVAPTAEDVYWGSPGKSSLKYASEIHTGKGGTDVVMVGSAHAPGGRAVSEMLVAISVAGRRKVVRVSGDRTWRPLTGGISGAAPFMFMPLTYERAFGGTHEATGQATLAEERNPVGVGFRGRRSTNDVAGQKLPNLEDPSSPLKAFGDGPAPAGFGFIAPSWLPRRTHAGTYDQAWKTNRAPYLPRDFDRRFSNAASAGLAFDRFLSGGEALEVIGASRDGVLRLTIPRARPQLSVAIAGERHTPAVELETVLIEPDDERLCLSWRARIPCDKKALKIETITIDGGIH